MQSAAVLIAIHRYGLNYNGKMPLFIWLGVTLLLLCTLEKKGLSEQNWFFFSGLYDIRMSVVKSHKKLTRKLFHSLFITSPLVYILDQHANHLRLTNSISTLSRLAHALPSSLKIYFNASCKTFSVKTVFWILKTYPSTCLCQIKNSMKQ